MFSQGITNLQLLAGVTKSYTSRRAEFAKFVTPTKSQVDNPLCSVIYPTDCHTTKFMYYKYFMDQFRPI